MSEAAVTVPPDAGASAAAAAAAAAALAKSPVFKLRAPIAAVAKHLRLATNGRKLSKLVNRALHSALHASFPAAPIENQFVERGHIVTHFQTSDAGRHAVEGLLRNGLPMIHRGRNGAPSTDAGLFRGFINTTQFAAGGNMKKVRVGPVRRGVDAMEVIRAVCAYSDVDAHRAMLVEGGSSKGLKTGYKLVDMLLPVQDAEAVISALGQITMVWSGHVLAAAEEEKGMGRFIMRGDTVIKVINVPYGCTAAALLVMLPGRIKAQVELVVKTLAPPRTSSGKFADTRTAEIKLRSAEDCKSLLDQGVLALLDSNGVRIPVGGSELRVVSPTTSKYCSRCTSIEHGHKKCPKKKFMSSHRGIDKNQYAPAPLPTNDAWPMVRNDLFTNRVHPSLIP